jgi:probable HAF family extracellular repeat protein
VATGNDSDPVRRVEASTLLLAFVGAAATAIPTLCFAQAPNLIDLGVNTGYALNNAGQVVLTSGLYSGGSTTALPSLPGQMGAAAPLAINQAGEVVGSAVTAGSEQVATEYSGGTATNLFSSFTGREQEEIGTATGINSSGTVAGWINTTVLFAGPGAPILGFTYSGGTLTTLSVPCSPTSSSVCTDIAWNYVYGINDSNQLVGSVNYQPSNYGATNDAYLYSGGTWTDLGPGASYAINALEQVTGSLTIFAPGGPPYAQTGSYAFLYSGEATVNLGTLPGGKNSTGYAINASGQIVGSSDFGGDTTTHGFYYNGVMTDLNTIVSATDPLQPYVTLTDAGGINDNRLIVANGVDSRTGQQHAYLLQGPWIDIAPGSLSFASVAVGSTGPTQTVTITNSGGSTIALGDLSTSTNFSQTNTCGATLAPAGQCTASVALVPASAGVLTGSLTVPSDRVEFVVALSGTAPIAASIKASAATQTVGQRITLTWTSSPGSTCSASSTSDSFNGSIAASGSQMLTETTAGTDNYQISCTAPGGTGVNAGTSVVWTWPTVSASLSASPTSITAGQSITLTWSSKNATSCTASGGGPNDSWPGAKSTSGTQKVTESYALATTSVTLEFTIACTSSASNQTSKTSAQVTESSASSSSSSSSSGKSGGGSIDLWMLLGLSGLAVRRLKKSSG